MARFNEILSGRFNRALQKFLSMKGGPPSAQLASEVTPNIQFNQMGVDFRFLENWNRFGVGVNVPAIAAQNNSVVFRNPPLSNVMAVIERLSVAQGIADTLVLSLITGALAQANAVGQRNMDNRTTSGTGPTLGAVCQTTFGNNVAVAGGVIGRITIPGGGTDYSIITHEDQQLTIAPNDSLQVTGVAVNTVLVVNIWWRERFLEDSERT